MHKLCFYVPEPHLEDVKDALFAVGAGKIGNYDHCCWQSRGQGQFRPLEGSDPFIGQMAETEQLTEYKVEMVFDEALVDAVIGALLAAHPYETPAYQIWTVRD